ncbi:hypothetical protein GCM10010363_64930 [Streptomyces omiyaensis]|nr:hypothetical protein GCM10010363_64930 [Streptomyces omiyaensis]
MEPWSRELVERCGAVWNGETVHSSGRTPVTESPRPDPKGRLGGTPLSTRPARRDSRELATRHRSLPRPARRPVPRTVPRTGKPLSPVLPRSLHSRHGAPSGAPPRDRPTDRGEPTVRHQYAVAVLPRARRYDVILASPACR